MNIKKLSLISTAIFAANFGTAQAQTTIVDDNLINIATAQPTTNSNAENAVVQDAANATLDADYFATSSATSAIEFGPDGVGVVTGESGRQIHALFPTQTLNAVGDSLTASITFTTPTSINLDGANDPATPSGGNDVRFGLFDNDGLTGSDQLGQNISASSGTPNPLLGTLAGSFVELDVEFAASASGADLQIRRHVLASPSGRLIGTTGDGFIGGVVVGGTDDDAESFQAINERAGTDGGGSNSGGSLGYVFLPDNSYTINYTVERVEALDTAGVVIAGADNTIDITAEFIDNTAGTTVGSLTRTDITPGSFSFGMIVAGASTDAFGINSSPNEGDNGIDLTALSVVANIAGDVEPPVEEPAGDEICFPVKDVNDSVTLICI